MGDEISYDLLVNILSRLPVESLLRFRCVSKSWYSIISHDHYFCNLHRLHHKNNPTIVSSPLTTALYKTPTDTYFTKFNATAISTYDPLSLSLVSCRLLGFPSTQNPQLNKPFVAKSQIISSCHGVLCLGVKTKDDREYSLYLYNPSIRKFNFVISYPLPKYYLVGFGFAPLHNDYKVVMVSMDKPEPVKVYSLRNTTTTWSLLPTAPVGLQPLHPARSATYLNGKCHWQVWIPNQMDDKQYDIKLPPNNSIWYFDLDSYKFGYLMPPDDCPSTIFLMVYKDMLSVYFSRNSEWNVWVMKEYGVFDSWSPLLTLDFSTLPKHYDFSYPSPSVLEMDVHSKILLHGEVRPRDNPVVLLTSDGEHDDKEIKFTWLDVHDTPLIVYDPQNKKYDLRRIFIDPSDYFHYQQSLVLLNQTPPNL